MKDRDLISQRRSGYPVPNQTVGARVVIGNGLYHIAVEKLDGTQCSNRGVST